MVSLKDACESGVFSWNAEQKKAFANNRSNHLPSCGRVNSSKGSAVPKDFLRRSRDGKGLDYKIVRWCEYVTMYRSVKTLYGLSVASNNKEIFNGYVKRFKVCNGSHGLTKLQNDLSFRTVSSSR